MAELEERTQYESFATQYDALTTVPEAILEAQYVRAALASIDIQGKTVLDLGGGSGLHARKAIAAGAKLVDLVDISPEMVKMAQAGEEELSSDRRDAIRYFIADAAKDLSGLSLQPQYDVVMVNWLLDHATSDDDLDAFWRNISAFTKPGGMFMGVRMSNPRTASVTADDAKYGIQLTDIRDIPGGVAYQVHVKSEPPFVFEGTSMEKSYSGSTVMHERHGFRDVTVLDPNSMDIVKGDPAFWKSFWMTHSSVV